MLDAGRYSWLQGYSLAFVLVASYDHHQEHLEKLIAFLQQSHTRDDGDGPSDTSLVTRFFRHNTWADLKLLDFCAGLGDDQLNATAVGTFGSIRDTLVHIVDAEVDYVNLAKGSPQEPIPSDPFPAFEELNDAVRRAGDELLQLAVAAQADTIVRVTRPQEPIYEYPLGGLLVQVLNHSTEHRTQISTIITQLGLEPPSMSGWKYMRELGEFLERGPEVEQGANG
jgi:uncharacterized damage-inducible protein DinB